MPTLAPEHLRTRSTAQLAARARALRAHLKRLAYRWRCDRPDCDGMPHEGMLHRHARATQRVPDGVWRIWLIMAGRGWGKTKTGSETVKEWGTSEPLHIAVIGENYKKCREICFEHPKSGLLAVIPPDLIAQDGYRKGAPSLTLTNGTVFRGLSAEKPDEPRGYAFDKAWYDEYASWPMKDAEDVNSNVWFALRESTNPQVVVTTTPKALPHVKRLLERHRDGKGVVLTRGHMRDNAANLGKEALEELLTTYEGTRLGRQELGGELLDDIEGALWALWMYEVEGFRMDPAAVPEIARMVVSVDPAVTSRKDSDASGIVVAGKGYGRPSTFADQRPHGYVFHAEALRATPEKTMRRVADLWHEYEADAVVIEANNGGDYLPAVLRQVDSQIPVEIVHATRGKITRAEPVAALYEQHRVHHVGEAKDFATLEEQQTTWTNEQGQESPDVMDALVWALWNLMLGGHEAIVSKARDQRLRGRR